MENKGHSRLSGTKSPYLLQHAGNPVDWYSWSEEAFRAAMDKDLPVFLSIGYSTCHWCHVMERESFSDPEVARIMNDNFISIKVDREERPDIDNLYMQACQIMTGRGGWPLSIIMTPDRIPFFAATYIPKYSFQGRIGMIELITAVHDLWKNRRSDITATSERVLSMLKVEHSRAVPENDKILSDRAYESLSASFDRQNSGFGRGPKFPTPHILMFLIRLWSRTGNLEARHMVEKTLRSMSLGGIRDHLGFGFHRYATDPEWKFPHFEKMLYDQAELSSLYLHAYQAFSDKEFAEEAESILAYVLRDLSAGNGGFFSAEDADSDGEEGRFYLWEHAELEKLLTEKDYELFVRTYGITRHGNYSEESAPGNNGRNILFREESLSDLSISPKIPEKQISDDLSRIREILFTERNRRIRPSMDKKILTDWNSLMISSLAIAGRVLDNSKYTDSAVSCADFILENMTAGNSRLFHRYYEGYTGIPGNLDDYAFFIRGLLDLYETTLDQKYLTLAVSFQDTLFSDFIDSDGGGFFFTASDSEKLPVRNKEIYGGPIPSGNAVTLHNLARFAGITLNPIYSDAASQLTRSFYSPVSRDPGAFTDFISSVDFMNGPVTELVISGSPGSVDTKTLLSAINSIFIPNRILLLLEPGNSSDTLLSSAPHRSGMCMQDGLATVYVCANNSCSEPASDIEHLRQILQRQKIFSKNVDK